MIIGITGKAGAGKDTVADILVRKHSWFVPGGVVKVALADPLKRICKDVFDFSDEQLWAESSHRNEPDARYFRCRSITGEVHLTPRYALQRLGTEWGRDCYDNVWVDYLLRVARKLLTKSCIYHQKYGLYEIDVLTPELRQKFELGSDTVVGAGVVIVPDVRFKNEVAAIRQAGGKVWRIVRTGSGLKGEAGQHKSETEQDSIEVDVTLVNDSTLEALEELAYKTFELTLDGLIP